MLAQATMAKARISTHADNAADPARRDSRTCLICEIDTPQARGSFGALLEQFIVVFH